MWSPLMNRCCQGHHDWCSSGLGRTPDSQIIWIQGGEGRFSRWSSAMRVFYFQNEVTEMHGIKNSGSQYPGSMWEKSWVFFFYSLEATKTHAAHSDLLQSVICVFQTHLFVFGKLIWNHWPCLWGLLVHRTYELTTHCWWVHVLARSSYMFMNYLLCLKRKG